MAEEFLQLDANDGGDRGTDSDQTGKPRERIKHLLIGSRKAVNTTIYTLHRTGYAEVREWSKPQAAGALGDAEAVVCVLLRSVRPE